MPNPPRPVAVKRNTVHHEAQGRTTRVTYVVRIIMSDGTEQLCEHEYGHQAEESFKRCAGIMFKRLAKTTEDGAA